MRTMTVIAAAIAIVCSGTSARADQVDSMWLLQSCKNGSLRDCYLGAASTCQDEIDSGGNGLSFAELRACIQENTARADAITSDVPSATPYRIRFDGSAPAAPLLTMPEPASDTPPKDPN